MVCKCNEYRNMLEDVVNALDLSEIAIEKHGPLGTSPAELVKLVLEEKDRIIMALKNGFNVSMEAENYLHPVMAGILKDLEKVNHG